MTQTTRREFCGAGMAAAVLLASGVAARSAADTRGGLRLQVNDDAGKPLPCRVHLAGPDGKPVRAPGLPFWRDHFVCDGGVSLDLPTGRYAYQVERGPEWGRAAGAVEVEAGKKSSAEVPLQRLIELRRQGWYCADLHVHRPVEDVPLLMRAEDLDVAPVITWWNKTNLWTGKDLPRPALRRTDDGRHYDVMAGEDERGGGALLFFNLESPLEIAAAQREYPCPVKYIDEARRRQKEQPQGAAPVWIDIEKPFWWDVPLWLADGRVDSIGICHNHMHRMGVMADEAWGRPRDKQRLPDPQGNGYWTQEIYYHALNCGLRVPPSAGSASGVLPNPVGHNRVYVHLDGEFSHDAWWLGLAAGRSFVTNGPLLLCTAGGKLPGHIFRADVGMNLELPIELRLRGNDPIQRVEVIKDGRIDSEIPLRDADGGKHGDGKVKFSGSGWFLVRAIADVPQTFRFASTAPFYVEAGDRPRRVSLASAKFFLEWATQRKQRVATALRDPEQSREVLAEHEKAEQFWRQRAAEADAE